MGSLKLKLIGWFSLVLLLVLFVFSSLIYLGWRKSLKENLDADLKSQAYHLASQLELDEGQIRFKSPGDIGLNLPRGWYYEVFSGDSGYNVLSNIINPYYSKQDSIPPDTLSYSIQESANDNDYRWITYQLLLKGEENEVIQTDKTAGSETHGINLIIRIGSPLDGLQDELEDLLQTLIIIGCLVMALSCAGGYFLAHKALYPINNITKVLADITDKHLDIRVKEADFDRELHPLVRQLNAALDRLEKGFLRERQFLSNASHELRTPLAVLINNTEVILNKSRSLEEYRNVHYDNLETARQMQEIIEGLLTLSRMDSGRVFLKLENMDFYSLVEDVFVELRGLAVEHQVILKNNVPNPFMLMVDVIRFKQVLRNLIENGIIYNRAGGDVVISASTAAAGGYRIEVSDNGPGIPPQHLPHIFESFYRADDSRSQETGGTGLGLAIVKGIVELHKGYLEAASSAEKTVFSIILPGR